MIIIYENTKKGDVFGEKSLLYSIDFSKNYLMATTMIIFLLKDIHINKNNLKFFKI